MIMMEVGYDGGFDIMKMFFNTDNGYLHAIYTWDEVGSHWRGIMSIMAPHIK